MTLLRLSESFKIMNQPDPRAYLGGRGGGGTKFCMKYEEKVKKHRGLKFKNLYTF